MKNPFFHTTILAAALMCVILFACKKEEPADTPADQPFDQSYDMDLSGQQWVLYQYRVQSNPYVAMNDTLVFVSDTIVMWNDTAFGYYAYAFSGHSDGKFLHFHDSPYGPLPMAYPFDLNLTGPAEDSICCTFHASDTTLRDLCFDR